MMSRRTLHVLLFVAGVAVLVAVNAAASPPRSVAAAHRSAAVASANRILAHVVMPAGSVRVSTVPEGASSLRPPPPARLWFQAQVDRRSLWTTNADESAAFDSIRSHLPAGWDRGFSAGSGSAGFEEGSFSAPTVEPRVLGTRQLVVSAVPLSSGETAVRVDAEVQYLAPRTPAQRIPAAARVLQITRQLLDSHSPQLALTVTARGMVHRIATDVDALPFGGNWHGAEFSCPSGEGNIPFDSFTFRATATGPVLARFRESAGTPPEDDPCATASLTIRGHNEPAIVEGGTLLHEVDRLLNVRLTAGLSGARR